MTPLIVIIYCLSNLITGLTVGLIFGIQHGYRKGYHAARLRYSNDGDAVLYRARQLTH